MVEIHACGLKGVFVMASNGDLNLIHEALREILVKGGWEGKTLLIPIHAGYARVEYRYTETGLSLEWYKTEARPAHNPDICNICIGRKDMFKDG